MLLKYHIFGFFMTSFSGLFGCGILDCVFRIFMLRIIEFIMFLIEFSELAAKSAGFYGEFRGRL
jgi:hypothetical protein